MDSRKQFLQSLRQTLGVVLRADGFGGSGSNYRRFRDPVVQVINIQGSRYGGECCVNLGVHLAFLPTIVGSLVDPAKITEPECEFRGRLKPEGEADQWWSYGSDEASAMASAARLTELYVQRGKPRLDQWLDFPGRFTAITVEDLEGRRPGALPGRATTVRAALALARMHAHLGDHARAREFAALGLKDLGQASGLQRDLDRLLRSELEVPVQRTACVEIELGGVRSSQDLHERLAKALGFPHVYGQNWDAFGDAVMGLVAMPENLVLRGWGDLNARWPRDAQMLSNCLMSYNEQFPRLPCNIQRLR